MFEENENYNKVINRQSRNYVKNKKTIQNKVNKLLIKCNTQWLIGSASEIDKKINKLGGQDKLIYIGGGGVIFKSKKKDFELGMLVADVLKQRNLRLNFYGGLYYELCNNEYCIGLTTVREILQGMGVKYNITENDIFTIDDCYAIDPKFFNYTVSLYKHNFKEYF